MGRLTDDMVRLCGEITSARDARMRYVAAMKGRVAAMTGGFRKARAELAARSNDARAAFVSQLRTDVLGLRQEVSTDLAAARRAFFAPAKRPFPGPAPKARPATAGRPAGEAGRAAAKEAAAGEGVPKQAGATGPEKAADNLQAVSGIGPAMEKRLQAAGIRSFARLARATPGELRGILGDRARLANVEDWVVQAKKLAKDQGRPG